MNKFELRTKLNFLAGEIPNKKYDIHISHVLIVILILIVLVGLYLAISGIIRSIKNHKLINQEVDALVKGKLMKNQKKARKKFLRKKGFGIRFKLIFSIILLTLFSGFFAYLCFSFFQAKTNNQSFSQILEEGSYLIPFIEITLFAIFLGIIWANICASLIISPIRRLSNHIRMISQTVNKETLEGKESLINSNDELGILGDTINEMTENLVKAAQEEHLLRDGKLVQQTFLPLSTDKWGNKQTTANFKNHDLEFVGYYESAFGVSGDYFDYKQLDERWCVVIKCDVSGHGIPSALLMIVVATLFRKHFETWKFENDGTDLTNLICIINDFIEELGIKGKFATIILSLIDTKTGDVYFCNAGDNVVHIYDSQEKKQKILTLQETPAAGPLPSSIIKTRGGFKMEKAHLNKNDIIFLCTDGIQESSRKFRDRKFNIIKCAEPGLKKGDIHKNHKVGLDHELMESKRMTAIIEAVLNKKLYVLEKYHNPIPDERLEFDFSKGNGTVQEAILALCSVEKVFRLYKTPNACAKDIVRVDKKIDLFLKKYFNRYDFYCSEHQEIGEESSYLYYTHLFEDEQLDDLTLVAVKI